MDGFSMSERPRRNRRTEALRALVRETVLRPSDFVWPVFVVEGESARDPISAMPGCERYSIDVLVEEARAAYDLGIPAIALFPALAPELKDRTATESMRPDGLLQRAVRRLKMAVPEMLVITDVAMDPYSSDGHDGLVEDGRVLNDETLPILAGMAVSQAEAGADIVAPSDMMDGRVGFIRDDARRGRPRASVGVMSYAAKYASARTTVLSGSAARLARRSSVIAA